MEELIKDVQIWTIDLSPWNSCELYEIPIIIMMYKSHKWLNVGTYYCPNSEESFISPAALNAHWKTQHGKHVLPNEHTAIEYIYNIKMRWKNTDFDISEGMPKYRNIRSCPSGNCNYIFNNVNALTGHIKSKHALLETLFMEVGLLWASIITFARDNNKLMPAKDLFNARNSAICLCCRYFLGQDKIKVQQHTKSSHPAAITKGSRHMDIINSE